MITKRITDPTWIASCHDSSMRSLSYEAFRAYAENRNLEKAGIDKDGNLPSGEKVTLFKVRPLKRELVDLTKDRGPFADRVIFSWCVTDVKNIDFDISKSDSGTLTDEVIDRFGQDDISDVAGYCCDVLKGKNGDTTPFTLPDGWRDLIALQARELARAASIENVSV
jgi:hypothetical protein